MTTSKVLVVMPEGTALGTKVWVSTAWVSPTDELGFLCSPVSATTNSLVMVAAGG